MLFQQIVVSAGVVNVEVQQLLHSVMGLEYNYYRCGASPEEGAFSWCGQLESAKCLHGEKVILRVHWMLSLCAYNWRVQKLLHIMLTM